MLPVTSSGPPPHRPSPLQCPASRSAAVSIPAPLSLLATTTPLNSYPILRRLFQPGAIANGTAAATSPRPSSQSIAGLPPALRRWPFLSAARAVPAAPHYPQRTSHSAPAQTAVRYQLATPLPGTHGH